MSYSIVSSSVSVVRRDRVGRHLGRLVGANSTDDPHHPSHIQYSDDRDQTVVQCTVNMSTRVTRLGRRLIVSRVLECSVYTQP